MLDVRENKIKKLKIISLNDWKYFFLNKKVLTIILCNIIMYEVGTCFDKNARKNKITIKNQRYLLFKLKFLIIVKVAINEKKVA